MRRTLAATVWLCGALTATAGAAEPAAGTVVVHPADGARMVYVPAGPFAMGLSPAEADRVAKDLGFPDGAALWAWDCHPRRTVELPGFFVDETETTVARWKAFVAATGHVSKSRETSRHFDRPEDASLPAGEIAWDEAKAYARWAGKSLPTDAQWEKAARGTDGRLYPWGNEPPTPDRGHFGTKAALPKLYFPVGSHPTGASPYGALDMLGNQYEWTADWLEPYPGNPQADKMKDYSGGKVVSVRGGSWYHGWIGFYAAKRFGLEPKETYYHVGFRTVWTPPEGYFDSPDFDRDRRRAAETPTRPLVPIRTAATPPTIDGRLDDDCWRTAIPVVANYRFGAPGQRTEPSPLVARFAWDARHLYVGYDATDADLVTVPTGRESGPPGNRRPTSEEWAPEKNLDLVEFFVTIGDARRFWEVHVTAGNQLNDHWCEVPSPESLAKIPKPTIADLAIHRDRFIPDDGAATVARAVRMKPRRDGSPSTVDDPSDRDAGFTGELRLPWAGLGVPAERRRPDGTYDLAGLRLRLLAVSLDGHGGQATYCSSAPGLPSRMFHFSLERWPQYVLEPAAKTAP